MRAIFVAQGSSMRLFYRLACRLREEMDLEKVGFYFMGSMTYANLLKIHPEIESSDSDFEVLKEWDITRDAPSTAVDMDVINKYEERIGDPWLWNPIILDRRLIHGKKVKLRQDYPPRFEYEELLKIVQTGLVEIDHFIDRIDPDFILSFVPATFGAYLFHLFAEERTITYLQLKSVKISNYATFSSGIFENHEHIIKLFRTESIDDKYMKEAESYLEKFRKSRVVYDGTTAKDGRVGIRGIVTKSQEYLERLPILMDTLKTFYTTEAKNDNYNAGVFQSLMYGRFVRPLRHQIFCKIYNKKFVKSSQLGEGNYAYFPLHTEPEIALSLYARPYVNQIEVIRNIAQSIPVGMKLYVKEHPRSFGMRDLSYYKKILQMPNVSLVHPTLDSLTVSENAKLVVVISGHAGFEALIQKKPVITLGHCHFNALSMVRHVRSLYDLPYQIKDALDNYEHDEGELVRFVAATMAGSAPVNLYSKLLNWDFDIDIDASDDFERLAAYTKKRLEGELAIAKNF